MLEARLYGIPIILTQPLSNSYRIGLGSGAGGMGDGRADAQVRSGGGEF